MSENFEAAEFELAKQRFRYKQVVERTAAQANSVDRRFFSEQARQASKRFDQPVVESATDCFPANFAAEIFDDGAE